MSRSLTVLATLVLGLTVVQPALAVGRHEAPTAGPVSNASGPASDLRITLGRLLGEHAHLLMTGMRAVADGAPDQQALVDGLDANTDALQGAIASVYGDAAGEAFRPIWQQHIDATFAWARASKAGDQPGVDAALAEMADYRTTFAKFLMSANPKISGDAEIHALQLHLDQLTSFLGQDFEQAFATERAAYSHMFAFGDDLARAIVAQYPDRFPDGAVAFSPRTTLRLTLGRLLGEHLVVAAEAMRAALLEREDAGAAAASLEANSGELAGAIGRVFGADAQTAFAEVWGSHVKTYLAYIEAIRGGDATARTSALASLHGYHVALATFLHGAIPALPQADLETLISHHVSALINQVDATAAGDHVRAVGVTREAYAQMFVVGDALGSAIADLFPERFDDVKQIPPTDTEPEPLARNGTGGSWGTTLGIAAGLVTMLLALFVLPRPSRLRHLGPIRRRP